MTSRRTAVSQQFLKCPWQRRQLRRTLNGWETRWTLDFPLSYPLLAVALLPSLYWQSGFFPSPLLPS